MGERVVTAAVQAIDPAVFAELFRQVNPKLGPYIHRLTGNLSLVDEVVSGTWLRVVERLETFDVDRLETFPAWVRRIAHNVAIDLVRSPAVWREVPSGLVGDIAAVDAESVEDIAEQRLRAWQVRAAVRELRPSWRRAVTLHSLHGLPYVETAARLGLSPSTVKGFDRLARKALAEALVGAA